MLVAVAAAMMMALTIVGATLALRHLRARSRDRRRRGRSLTRVNCWFCAQDQLVPRALDNRWTCAGCGSYNGFTPDGDYNAPLPSLPAQPSHAVRGAMHRSSHLCVACNAHQELIVSLMAQYEPRDEARAVDEYRTVRAQLEARYPLCAACQVHVAGVLRQQDRDLRTRHIARMAEHSRLARIVGVRPGVVGVLWATAAITRAAFIALHVAALIGTAPHAWNAWMALAAAFAFVHDVATLPAVVQALVELVGRWGVLVSGALPWPAVVHALLLLVSLGRVVRSRQRPRQGPPVRSETSTRTPSPPRRTDPPGLAALSLADELAGAAEQHDPGDLAEDLDAVLSAMTPRPLAAAPTPAAAITPRHMFAPRPSTPPESLVRPSRIHGLSLDHITHGMDTKLARVSLGHERRVDAAAKPRTSIAADDTLELRVTLPWTALASGLLLLGALGASSAMLVQPLWALAHAAALDTARDACLLGSVALLGAENARRLLLRDQAPRHSTSFVLQTALLLLRSMQLLMGRWVVTAWLGLALVTLAL